MDFFIIAFGAAAAIASSLAFFFYLRAQQMRMESAMLQRQASQWQGERESIMQNRLEAEKRAALAQQRLADMELRMRDWEAAREQSMQASRAAILSVGQELSSKLLEDHKREAEAARKESTEMVQKTTESLSEHLKTLGEKFITLQDKHAHADKRLATLWHALSTPSGVGQLTEIGLENSLKNIGLIAGRDYTMQYAITSSTQAKLRPDAVVYLPNDRLMVIDAKASKFLLEIAQAQLQEGIAPEEVKMLREQLKKTMNDHLKALISKDYRGVIAEIHKASGREERLGDILYVMYLPSEAAVEQVRAADAEFMAKCERAQVILVGPGSLVGVLSLAHRAIADDRQVQNEQEIISLTQDVLDALATSLSYVDKVGRNIKTSMEGFDTFARSTNRFLLPKLRKLGQLGVRPNKQKQLPDRIVSYETRESESVIIIDSAESEADSELVAREKALSLSEAV